VILVTELAGFSDSKLGRRVVGGTAFFRSFGVLRRLGGNLGYDDGLLGVPSPLGFLIILGYWVPGFVLGLCGPVLFLLVLLLGPFCNNNIE